MTMALTAPATQSRGYQIGVVIGKAVGEIIIWAFLIGLVVGSILIVKRFRNRKSKIVSVEKK